MNDSRASCRPSSMRGSRVTEYGGTGSLESIEYESVVVAVAVVVSAVSAAGVAGLSDEGGREEGLS